MPSFGVRSLDQACYDGCKNLALNIRDCASLVGAWQLSGSKLGQVCLPLRTVLALEWAVWCINE